MAKPQRKTQIARRSSIEAYVGRDADLIVDEFAATPAPLSAEQVDAFRRNRAQFVVDAVQKTLDTKRELSTQDQATLEQYWVDTLPASRDSRVGKEHFRYIGETLGIAPATSTRVFNLMRKSRCVQQAEKHRDGYFMDRNLGRVLRESGYAQITVVSYGHMAPRPDDYTLECGSIIDAVPNIRRLGTGHRGSPTQTVLDAMVQITSDFEAMTTAPEQPAAVPPPIS